MADDRPLEAAREININSEVEWGRSYRHQKKQARRISIAPRSSPINMQQLWQQYQMSKQLQQIKELKRKLITKQMPRMAKLPKGRVDPNTVSKKKYYDYMSTPHKHYEPPPKVDPLKKPHKPAECSPRLIYLSVPTKVRVLSTWKDYQHRLPIDFIVRLEELLHTDYNLDPKFARCYFKTLDRFKKKRHGQMKRKCRRRQRRKAKQSKEWLRYQIQITAALIVKFLRNEPLFKLNFKQMMLSDAILDHLHGRGDIRNKPARNTSKPYGRAVVDIVDQLSVWMDTIVRYVDVQYTESVEEVVEVSSVGSMLGEDEDEEEEEEEEQEAPPKRFSLPPLPVLPEMTPLPDVPGMPLINEEVEGGPSYEATLEDLHAVLGQVAGEESQPSLGGGSMGLSEDALELLINILSYSTPDQLQQLVNPDDLPGITYQDIFDRLQALRDQAQAAAKKQRQLALEEAIITWAKANQPDKIDDRLLHKIQDAAGIISECLTKDRSRGRVSSGPKEDAAWESAEEASFTQEAIEPVSESITEPEPEPEPTIDEPEPEPEPPSEPEPESITDGATTEDESAADDFRTLDTLPEEAEGGDITSLMSRTEDDDKTPQSLTASVATVEVVEADEDDELSNVYQDGEASEMPSWIVKVDETTNLPTITGAEPEETVSTVQMDMTGELNVVKVESHPAHTSENILDVAPSGDVTQMGSARPSIGRRSTITRDSKSSIPNVIPGHQPSRVFEHQPDTICCLTLKVWATWLLEVAHNAHAWSRWLNDIIHEVRRIASIIRGEIKDEAGHTMMFYKEDWIDFSGKVDNMITSWRQYSMHVKDLTDKIVHNFRGKTVTCCPRCLEDNLIVDVGLAHNISQQLAEAMNTAGYWRRWLDSVVMETKRLTGAAAMDDNESQASSYGTMEIVELHEPQMADSEESLYEIEEIDPNLE